MSTKSEIESNDSSRSVARKPKISRRRFLPLLACSGGAVALSACGSQTASAPAATPPAFEGYSIFHETMVEMAWPEIKQAAQDGAIVLLPLGIIEEHGPHMSLAVDIYTTYNWCKMARKALEARGIKTLIAPPNYWGVSPSVSFYPGTFSVQPSTLANLLYDMHASLHQWGFEYVFTFNAHGDGTHNRIYESAVQQAHDKLGMNAYFVVPKNSDVTYHDVALFFPYNPEPPESISKNADIHAGASETAKMLAFFPQVVDTEVAKTLQPSTSFEPLGYWGDPARFAEIKAEEVREWADAIATVTAETIEAFLKDKKQ